MFKQRYYGLYIGIGIPFVILLSSYFGVFNLPNAIIYDAYVSYSPVYEKSRPNVLLIDASEEQRLANNDQWLKLLAILNELDAKQISFTFFPENTTSDFYRETVHMGNVLFAQKLVASAYDPQEQTLVPLPKSTDGIEINTAVSVLMPSTYGMYRNQLTSVIYDDQHINTFEMEAAQQFYGYSLGTLKESFQINFMGGAGQLPIITMGKVFSGDLVPELVANRSIIIGSTEYVGATISVPVADNNGLISSLAFHGYALDTLLSDKAIDNVNWVANFVYIVLIVGLSLLIYQRLGVGISGWLTIIIIALYSVFTWISLVYFQIWQPITELCSAQLLTFLAFLDRRVTQDNLVMRQVLLETSTQIRERIYLPSFYESKDPWTQVITMINQMLDLNRVILLERVVADHRVKEVKALNCSLEDINEMRRDYERTPYSTAIEHNGPVIVTKYLRDVDYDEVQYLVPLVFTGEVLGFWAFGISPNKVSGKPNFDTIVNDFSAQIAELLHYRQEWLRKQAASENKVHRYLQLEGGEQEFEELNKAISMMELRLVNLEYFLDGLKTATIIYDLFGRVMLVNSAMEKLLEHSDFAPYEMTALDLITQLSGMEASKIRSLIESVVVDRHATSISINILEDKQKIYLMHISPLLSSGKRKSVTDTTPFNISGILCELMDVSTVKQLSNMKENLVQYISNQLHQDISVIQNTSSLLVNGGLSQDEYDQAINQLNEKSNSAAETISQSEAYLVSDLWAYSGDGYPVNAKEAIDTAIRNQNEIAKLRAIRLKHNFPEFISLVLAEKDELIKLFDSILHLLLQDAAENTLIFIKFEKNNRQVKLTFSNSGFGMPNERFQQYLIGHDGNENMTSSEFRKLRGALRYIKDWEGDFSGRSEVGMGTHFIVKLRSFI